MTGMYFDENNNEVRNVVEVFENNNIRYPSTVDKLVLSSEQIRAIEIVLDHWSERHKKDKDKDPRENIEVNTSSGLPVVYIAEYTIHDNYGSLRQQDVFALESDALNFINNLDNATAVSVKSRMVFLDKYRSVKDHGEKLKQYTTMGTSSLSSMYDEDGRDISAMIAETEEEYE